MKFWIPGLAPLMIAVACFCGRQTGTAARAADTTEPDAVKSFLVSGERHVQLMDRMLQHSDETVERLHANYPGAPVPLGQLHSNPFREMAANSPASTEALSREREEENRSQALQAFQGLKLQSVLRGETRNACLINNQLYHEGEQAGIFRIDQISPTSVIVKAGPYRFELGVR